MVLNFIEARCVKARAALSSSTAVLALMLVVPGAAQAQEASVETVTVSASRIQSAGFTAPTPTTVISGDDLVKQGNTNVFTTITQLPSLMGSTGTSVGNGGSSNGVNGLSTLNLRNLGTNRNLILIDGERVVRGQRMMQAATDIFLSWQRSTGLDGLEHDFYVRQLWDWKASADLSRMSERGLLTYSRACAWSLARSHARSGDRLAIASYLGQGRGFDRTIARFSAAYADQNERDYALLQEGVNEGKVTATAGI